MEEDPNKRYVILSIAEKYKYVKYFKYDEEAVLICSTSSGTSSGPFETKIKYYNGKFDFTNMLTKINPKIEFNMKYLYYYLNSIKKLIEDKYGKGSSNKSLDKTKFMNLEIPHPTLEVQEQCVEIYQSKEAQLKEYDDKIERQQQYIEELKVLGKDIISSFCNSS